MRSNLQTRYCSAIDKLMFIYSSASLSIALQVVQNGLTRRFVQCVFHKINQIIRTGRYRVSTEMLYDVTDAWAGEQSGDETGAIYIFNMTEMFS